MCKPTIINILFTSYCDEHFDIIATQSDIDYSVLLTIPSNSTYDVYSANIQVQIRNTIKNQHFVTMHNCLHAVCPQPKRLTFVFTRTICKI